MNDKKAYQNLNFDKRSLDFPKHLLVEIGVPVAFILAWFLLPPSAFFWLTLLLVIMLTWISTYGWPKALAALINFLQRQQRI